MATRSHRSAQPSGAVRPRRRGRETLPPWTQLATSDGAYFSYALVTFVTFLFASLWAGAGIFASMLVTAAYLLTRTRSEHARIWRATPVLAYAGLALISTLWSEASDITLRLSLQFAYTAFLGVVLYRTVSYRLLLRALLVATASACFVSLLIGQQQLQSGFPLNGIYESKNMMAFTASTSLLAAMAVGFDATMSMKWRACAAAAALIELACLIEAQSAGALVSTTLACGVLVAAKAFSQAAFRVRLLVLVAAIVFTPAVSVAIPYLEQTAQTFQTDILKKDDTLTGRTYLWGRAKEYIAEKPIVGHGYASFWRQGSLEAEGLWAAMGITNRSGFNFHNQYVEALMDTGLVGLLAFIATELLAASSLAARLLLRPTRELPFYIGMLVALLMRTPVESVILVQFSTLTVLFFTTCAAGIFGETPLMAIGKADLTSRRPGSSGRSVRKAALPQTTAPRRQKKLINRSSGKTKLSRFKRSQAAIQTPAPQEPQGD